MTTQAQLIEWLKDDSALRCVLMEVVVSVGGIETTRYMSNRGYVTGGLDTPANTVYNPLISGGIKFTESLSLEGNTSLSYGDIDFYNPSGEIDSWLDDVWANRSVKMFIGDVKWGRNQFYKIFDGVVSRIDSRSRDKISLSLSDKMQRLNTVVSEVKLGGATPNADKLIPLLFGECHNITPLLVDAATEEYQVHNGPIESIIEVRDNGVPVSITPFVLTGKFRLNQAAVGTITCSAQGDKPVFYVNNAATLIKRLVKDFGNAQQKLVDADLDLTTITAFEAANTQPVGLYLTEKANVLDCVNKLASSVGARAAMTRDGLLKLVKIALPRTDSGTLVTSADMTERSLSITQLPPVVAAIKLGYCKNHTVQAALQTGLPSNHIELFAQGWLTVTETDTTVATAYKLFTDPVMAETQLLTTADAEIEAARRLALFNVQRRVLKYRGLPHLMLEGLGDTQTLQHTRFGLSAGVAGQIILLATDWLNPHIEIDVLV